MYVCTVCVLCSVGYVEFMENKLNASYADFPIYIFILVWISAGRTLVVYTQRRNQPSMCEFLHTVCIQGETQYW